MRRWPDWVGEAISGVNPDCDFDNDTPYPCGRMGRFKVRKNKVSRRVCGQHRNYLTRRGWRIAA